MIFGLEMDEFMLKSVISETGYPPRDVSSLLYLFNNLIRDEECVHNEFPIHSGGQGRATKNLKR